MRPKINNSIGKLLVFLVLILIGVPIVACAMTATTYAILGPGYDLNPSWSPDGELLVYECFKPHFKEWLVEGSRYYGDLPYPPSSAEICTIDIAGQNQNRLTQNRFNDYNPQWSPDGRQIAFISDRDGSNALYLMSQDGSNQRKITNGSGSSGSFGNDIAWSPDSRRIAFTRHGYDFPINQGGLYVIDLVTGEETKLIGGHIFTPGGLISTVAWSPLGDALAFIAREADGCTIHIIDSKTAEPITNPMASACDPVAWSPSGTDLAFMGIENDEIIPPILNLQILNLQTQTVTQLPIAEDLLEGTLAWSSDADSVFYLAHNSIKEVAINDLQQRTIVKSQQLLVHVGARNYSLSPDGKHLVFVIATGRKGNAQIWQQALDGTVQIRLSQ